MTRETKIGIALMVLLIGVFGAMVYKKWNGRQPAAVANAAVADATEAGPTPAAEEDPFAATPAAIGPTPAPLEPTPVAMEPTPASDNPFAAEAAAAPAAPVAQSDPNDPFGDAGFVRSEQPEAMPADSSSPPAQMEPGGAESLFADENLAAAEQPMPAMSDAAAGAGAATAAVDAVPVAAATEDPFADPVPAQPMAETAAAPAQPPADDDPFSDAPVATENLAGEMTEPAMTAETVESAPATIAVDAVDATGEPSATTVAVDDPFGDSAPAATEDAAAGTAAMTPAPETNVAESATNAVPAEEMTAAASPAAEEDPFAEPTAAADATAATDSMPGRFPEGVAAPVAAPVAAAEAGGTMQESSFEEPEGELDPLPMATPASPSGRLDHYVVADNDSYWTISKRVYGTPVYFHALARYNAARVPNPERLKPGMTILTPTPQELSARFPKLVSQGESTHAESKEPGFLIDDQGRPSYRVGKDDTLTEIAQSHLGRASRWMQIYEMNREIVQDPKTLKPGSVLRLPADASRVRLVPEG